MSAPAEAGLLARIKIAEKQLADAHTALDKERQGARTTAQEAAQLVARLDTVTKERDRHFQNWTLARREVEEAVTQRDEIRQKLQVAETMARQRLQRAEDLERNLVSREASLADTEARVHDLERNVNRRLVEAEVWERQLLKRQRECEDTLVEVRRMEEDAKKVLALKASQDTEREHLVSVREELERREAEVASQAETLEKAKEQEAKALRNADAANAAAEKAYERGLLEERRWKEAVVRCNEEQRRIESLQANRTSLEEQVRALEGAVERASVAQAKCQQEMLDLAKQRESLNEQRKQLETLRSCLELQEQQAKLAAEEARKEQVVLACARRDASKAAAEMQKRHLDAASSLEGPGPGAASSSAYESLRAERVLGQIMALSRQRAALSSANGSSADSTDSELSSEPSLKLLGRTPTAMVGDGRNIFTFDSKKQSNQGCII